MSTAAERIHEARERDLAKGEQEEPDEAEEAETEAEPAPEPDEPQPEPQPEPEQPEQPQPPAGLSAEQAGELEKVTTRYYKAIDKVFGGNSPPECSHCNGLGFDLTGGAGVPEYRTASDKDVCDECDGLGGVLSGSKVPGQDVVRCERCKGAGYLITRQVTVVDPDQVAPVVVQLAEGNADGGQAAALKPGDPGWEPWMGGGEVAS